MSNARLTINEANAFLDANPAVQWINAFLRRPGGFGRPAILTTSAIS